MEQLLHRAAAMSDLAYLRVLQLVHIQASSLVEDLKVYELPASGSRMPFESGELNRTLGSANTGPTASTTLTAMLETAMEELFVPYTEGQRYLERESQSLGTLYAGLLMDFTRYHQVRVKHSLFMYLELVYSIRLFRLDYQKANPQFSIEWSISLALQPLPRPLGAFKRLLLKQPTPF